MSRPSEDEIIAEIFAPLSGAAGLGLADDAACLTPPHGHDLVLTTDTVTAGVHFFADDAPQAIAAKALRVNLSDLAAKAATPLAFLLNLALPDDWTPVWLADFAAALGEDARRYACPLAGGDTVKTLGPLTLSITALGTVPTGAMVPRGGALAGDLLYVSGTIGDAALGLQVRRGTASAPWIAGLDPQMHDELVQRYLYPQPRLALGNALRAHARAAMDISDGLAGDLAKMLRLSKVSATLDFADIPLSPAAAAALRLHPDLAALAISGGDDYEILAAVPPAGADAFESQASAAGIQVSMIGAVTPDHAPPVFRDRAGQPMRLSAASFQHF